MRTQRIGATWHAFNGPRWREWDQHNHYQGVSWDQKYVFCTFKNTKRRRPIFLIFNKIIENIPSQPFVLMGLDFKTPAMWWTMNNVLKYLMKLVSWPAGAGIKQGNLFGWREFGMLARNTHTWWSLFLFFRWYLFQWYYVSTSPNPNQGQPAQSDNISDVLLGHSKTSQISPDKCQ